MLGLANKPFISPENYLAAEHLATLRHEYVQGEVYAMAGASDGHVTINVNLVTLIKAHLRGSACKPYINDMKVRIGEVDLGLVKAETLTRIKLSQA